MSEETGGHVEEVVGEVVAPELARDDQWQRLDPRMLLVHPIREVFRFLPVLLGIVFVGSTSGGIGWEALGIVVPVALGVLRYLTTSFRVAAGRVELRRGLLNRHVLSTPLDRVRTVDLTAGPVHRLLGLTTVRVGTGTASLDGDEQLDLDALPRARAAELRAGLLRAVRTPTGDPDLPAGAAPAPPVRTVVAFDPAWLRFAPLTSTGVVASAAVLGAAAQGLSSLGAGRALRERGTLDVVVEASLWLLVPVVAVLAVALVSVVAVGTYLLANWGFTLTHDGARWHLRRGLLTTRETTVDDERVAGVVVAEPIGLRLARGGRLSAVVTGLDRSQQGSSELVPPAPVDVVRRTARSVLGVAGPVDAPVVPHGPAARRRRYVRALGPTLAVAAAAVVGVVALDLSRWALVTLLAVPLGLALARDRSAALGHALVDGYLVARSGSILRRRDVLATEHVIGWTFRATWFQRRAGLTTLVATTAGGSQSVTVLDVPAPAAVGTAEAAVPDLVGQFLAHR